MKGCPYCGKFGGVTSWTDFGGIPTYRCSECGNSWKGILPIQESFRAKREMENCMCEKATKAALSEEYDRIKPAAINALIKGERLEYMHLKDGLKVVRVRREEVKCGKKV